MGTMKKSAYSREHKVGIPTCFCIETNLRINMRSIYRKGFRLGCNEIK